MNKVKLNDEELGKAFEFLDDIRESGEMNMFAARPDLVTEFNLEDVQGALVLALWMKTFDRDSTIAERVRKAQII